MIRILLLRAGSTAPEVRRDHGDYDRWFSDAVARRADQAVSWDVHEVTRPAAGIPPPSPYAGVIVTGSTSAAHRPEPWMGPLAGFLGEAERHGRPVLCVCFGMQLLAQARGGLVGTSPLGWEIGGAVVALTPEGRRDPLFAGLPDRVKVLATHQDRVEALPPGSVLLASNACSPVQAFRAARDVWGVQFHPEATPPIIETLIRLRAPLLGEAAGGAAGVDELLATLHDPEVTQGAAVLDNFLRICGDRAGAPLTSARR